MTRLLPVIFISLVSLYSLILCLLTFFSKPYSKWVRISEKCVRKLIGFMPQEIFWLYYDPAGPGKWFVRIAALVALLIGVKLIILILQNIYNSQ